MKKNMNFFISLLISVQISWTPLYPIYADELQPQPSLDNIQNIESASKNLKVEGGKRLYQAQKTAEWIANKEYSKLTKEIIDPFLLAQQEVLTFEKDTSSRHSFLNKVQSFNPSDIPIDQLKFKIEGKTLKLVSYEMTDEKSNESRYRKRAEQIFRGIEAIQVTQDKELALVLDSKGRVFSIDMGLVLQQAFRSPIPLFSVFDLKSHLKASPSQEMRIEFLSRGLKPFVQQEVESSKNRNKIIPRDSQGSPLFKSGDVVVYTDGPKRSLKALLSLKQIQNQTRIGTIYLSWLIFQLTHQGQESNFSEKLQKQLRIEGDGKGLNPLETLIKNIKKENLQTKVDNFSEKIFEQIKTNPILAEVLRKHTRQSFKQNTDRYEQIHQSSQQGKDQFTISQWENSSKKIIEQANLELRSLQKQIDQVQSKAEKALLEEKRESLLQQKRSSNFRQSHQDLLENSQRSQQTFSKTQKHWLSMINSKSLITISAISTAIGGYYYGIQVAPQIISGEIAVSKEIYLGVSWLYNLINPLLRDVGYVKILLASSLSLLAIIPTLQLLSWSSPKIAHKVSRFLPVKQGRQLIQQTEKWAEQDNFQRLSTAGARLYSYLLSIVDGVSAATGQNIGRTLRRGVTPKYKVTGNDFYGRSIGLNKNESLRLGLNNPLESPILQRLFPENMKSTKETRKKQNQALQLIESNQKNAQMLAWLLATIIVSEKKNIDPATLLEIQSGRMNFDEIKNLLEHKRNKERWLSTAKELNLVIEKIALNQKVDLSQVSNSDIQFFYKKGLSIADKLQKNQKNWTGRAKNTIGDLKRNFLLLGRNSLKTIGSLGQEEKDFLRKVFANKFVAERVRQEFVYDHAMVVGVPAVMGDRANIQKPEFLVAQEGKPLWTNPQHLHEVLLNTYAHLVASAAKRIMVFQTIKPEFETTYRPIENIFLKAASRPQSLFAEVMSWMQLLNVKKSNIGSYYIKDFVKRLKTVHVAIIIGAVGRLYLADQSLSQTLVAIPLMFFAAEWFFGYPWTLLSRGAQLSHEQVSKNREHLERVVRDISIYRRQGNQQKLNDSYKKLLSLHLEDRLNKNNNSPSSFSINSLKNYLKGVEQSMGLEKNKRFTNFFFLKKKLRKVMSQKEGEAFVIGIAALDAAIKNGDHKKAREIHSGLKDLIEEKKAHPEFKKLLGDLQKRASILGNFSLSQTPVPTEVHRHFEKFMTFSFGAVGTTYLFLSLAVLTFTPSYLTWANVGKWAAISAAGYSLLFLFASKKSWEELVPKISRAIKRTNYSTQRRIKSSFINLSKAQKKARTCRQVLMSL